MPSISFSDTSSFLGWQESTTFTSIAQNTSSSTIAQTDGGSPSIWSSDKTSNSFGEELSNSVGQPGEWESIIPVWGSGRGAIDHFQNGNYWRGMGYTALAVTDVFLVKAAYTVIAKGVAVAGTKIATKTLGTSMIKGFTKHSTNQAIERGFKTVGYC